MTVDHSLIFLNNQYIFKITIELIGVAKRLDPMKQIHSRKSITPFAQINKCTLCTSLHNSFQLLQQDVFCSLNSFDPAWSLNLYTHI